MKWLSVGQMAKLNQVSEQTLRLYDKEGLLVPCHRGGDNNYRYYDIKQGAILDMIQYMKSLGMKLKEIKFHLDNKDIGYLDTILHQRQIQIEEEINELKFQRRAVERTIESFERYRAAPSDGTIVMEYIGKRQMYLVDTDINFYDQGIEVYEENLRTLRNRLAQDKLPQIYFSNAGSILREKNLLERNFYSTEVFVFVDREFVSEELITTIPASTYLCIYCDNFYKEKEAAELLLDKIEEEGYTICGDYICETVAELPVIGSGERGMYLRLQIPIKFELSNL